MRVIVFGSLFFLIAQTQAVIEEYDETAFIETIRSKAPQGRIVAGWEATEGQIPYQASLRTVNVAGAVNVCGGTLIHHNWILTAGHCLAGQITIVVRLGLVNIHQPEVIVETTRRYFHPLFDSEELRRTQPNDIALLGLDQHITYGPNIQPCRIQSSQQKTWGAGLRLMVSGFGWVDDWWNGGEQSDVLRFVYVRGIRYEQCRQHFPRSTSLQRDTTLCAQFYNDTSQGSCNGDSGGPLVYEDIDRKPTLFGVVSFGHFMGCRSFEPEAYVRPGYYHDWLTEVTGINFDWNYADYIPFLRNFSNLEGSEFINSSSGFN
ncbi:collagenase-like [Leptidea sinapis]|uniref:collagenase-like n=1 Tax=Leptidea sinapis TaxID=189913 RepID=UPI00213AA60A|nr:collagenase-like [Leptidea sinapis]